MWLSVVFLARITFQAIWAHWPLSEPLVYFTIEPYADKFNSFNGGKRKALNSNKRGAPHLQSGFELWALQLKTAQTDTLNSEKPLLINIHEYTVVEYTLVCFKYSHRFAL